MPIVSIRELQADSRRLNDRLQHAFHTNPSSVLNFGPAPNRLRKAGKACTVSLMLFRKFRDIELELSICSEEGPNGSSLTKGGGLAMLMTVFGAGTALLIGICSSQAATIKIPNASFESPETPFVEIQFDSWQKTPKPFWYQEQDGFSWEQLTGIFRIPGPQSEEHIPNADGHQAMYLFAVPDAGVFQQDIPAEGNSGGLARFEVGAAYQLSAAVFGGAGGMTNGASMEVSLYYLDPAGNALTVAAASIVYTNSVFERRFEDYHLFVPAVEAGDPWADRPLGVRLLSTAGPEFVGGYWHVDNVRLTVVSAPVLLSPGWVDGQFAFEVRGTPGQRVDVLTSPDAAVPASSWQVAATLVNTNGSIVFIDSNAPTQRRFYQAREAR
jgi:hypothetical protein